MNAVPRPCPERELLLHGLADGELDALNALAVEDHLHSCGSCAAAYEDILRHKDLLRSNGLRFRAPASLRGRILDAVAAEDEAGGDTQPSRAGHASAVARKPGLRRLPLRHAGSAFSAMALAASLILFVNSWSYTPGLDNQLVASHVRSMLVSHLTDVASSDQHTVKPWFLGKLDFAPPVIELAQKGYPLIGGRLDFIGSQVVPAIVYKRNGHIINLFVWPAGKMRPRADTIDGYHVVGWTYGGFAYAAVSDLNLTELNEFQRDLIEALPKG